MKASYPKEQDLTREGWNVQPCLPTPDLGGGKGRSAGNWVQSSLVNDLYESIQSVVCNKTSIFYHLKHQGSPRILEWVAYPFSRGSSWPRNQTGVSCTAGRFFTSRAKPLVRPKKKKKKPTTTTKRWVWRASELRNTSRQWHILPPRGKNHLNSGLGDIIPCTSSLGCSFICFIINCSCKYSILWSSVNCSSKLLNPRRGTVGHPDIVAEWCST